MQMPWNKSCRLLCVVAGSTGVFLSKEQTLQGWHCHSQRVTGDSSSLLVKDSFPSPSRGTREVSALLKGWGCFSPSSMGGFWVGDLPQQDPTSFLEFLSAAALGDPWVLKGTRNNPWTRSHSSCPCSELDRGSTSHHSSNPAVPVPTTLSIPHLANPWITCYLNEPLARLLWLLTFLNDES